MPLRENQIKPENVLITDARAVKVTDFGLGKVQAQVAQSILFSGSLVSSDGRNLSGTLQYMSPQQQAGNEPDVRDDLYAVGIIGCELLTGSRPTPMGITKMLRRAQVDASFGAFLEKALEPEAGDRYGTAVEMLTVLDGLMVPTPGAGYREELDASAPDPALASTSDPASLQTTRVLRSDANHDRGIDDDLPRQREQPARGAAVAPRAIGDIWANSLWMKFASIPAGEFVMGSPPREEGREPQGADETQHRVCLSRSFYLGMTPVTQAQWKSVMGSNPSHFKGDNLPVESVSWEDATEFCGELSARDGSHYRLPTEAEWEYACRAATTTPFYFGATLRTEQANYNGNYTYGAGRKGVFRQKTTPVASFPANPWGLYDMHGNVAEWCADFLGEYPRTAVTDPTGPPAAAARVLRGGSWLLNPTSCRCADRLAHAPNVRLNLFGFRVAMDLP